MLLNANRLLPAVLLAAGRAPHTRFAAAAAFAQAASLSSKALIYEKPGEPEDVLKLQELPVSASLARNEVFVKFLASPINPSDINTVQGKYPLQPSLPGVPGHEGVAEVLATADDVSGLGVGDRVVPWKPALGTWRTQAVFSADDLLKAPSGLTIPQAATISINPPTALGLLESFVNLKPGDVVIQNGATGAVGQFVIQLAAAKGVKTVNLVRERPDMSETMAHLKALGATLVTTEDNLRRELKAADLPDPVLGLNCVGGSAALAVTKPLRAGSTMVTYGGMALQPVTVPTSLLIYKDITFRGFWVSGRWAQQVGREGKVAVLEQLAGYYREGKLRTECMEYPLERYKEALAECSRANKGHKVLLTFQ